jgi:hypothetical protein
MEHKALCLFEELLLLELTDQKLSDFGTFVQLGNLLHYPYEVLDVLGVLVLCEQLKDLV